MIVTFDEAKELTARVLELTPSPRPMVKLPIDNIVFDKLGAIPLLEMMLNLNIITKEHIHGTVYDKNEYQMVMRIIGGKLLMIGQDLIERPDAYAWPTSKVIGAKNRRALGFHSVEGAQTYAEILSTIKTQHERDLLTDLLVNWSKDLLLIHTDAEKRRGIEVTEDLLVNAIVAVPNSYDIQCPKEGAEGVELTPIKVGDVLVIEQCSFGTAFYVVGRDEFKETYSYNLANFNMNITG